MDEVRLTVIGKPECHLCDVADEAIGTVLDRLAEHADAPRVEVERRSILDDQGLYDKYWELIPVVLVNGEEHAHWKVSPSRLTTAILDAAGVPPRD